jgi:gliding motility-associated-like protein
VATGGFSMHNWDLGDNSNTISTNPSHPYGTADTFNVTLVVTSNFGCMDTAMGTAVVNPLPSATITATPSLSICSGDSINLSVPSSVTSSYSWNSGQTINSIYVDSSMNYVVVVTDINTGCSNRDSVDVSVLPRPTANAGTDTTISAGFGVMLNGSGGIGYSWLPLVGLDNPNIYNPTANPPYNVTYTLTVTDFNGCTDNDTVKVTLAKDFNIIIANLITANGDGHNDTWFIKNIEFYPNNNVHIYNRNGMEVYSAEGYHNDWDGTYNGAHLPDGTYYYVLKFPDGDKSFTGGVTIMSEK